MSSGDGAPPPGPGSIARRSFELRGTTFGAAGDLFLIAGPDLVEPLELCLRVGERVRDIAARLGVPYVFKGSFDKANRTSARGHRGPGIERGLENLRRIRDALGVPVLTDVHETAQAAVVAEVADVLQVPAFLCRQTDLIAACARTGKPLHVKKGQFLAPWDMRNVAAKIEEFWPGGPEGARAILCDRGTSFGYNALVSDLRGIPVMQETGYPVSFDATHSQQVPGGHGTRSGGNRAMIAPLARAAVAAGADGIFFEVHEDPQSSPVDPDTHLDLSELERLLAQLVAIKKVVAGG